MRFSVATGHYDAFVDRLNMLPTGVSAYGTSSAGCSGALAISVTSMPKIGNSKFSVTCINAPPRSPGMLMISGARPASPPSIFGISLLVDTNHPIFVVGSLTSNQMGAGEVQLPIPLDPRLQGARLYAQFVWSGPTAPAPCPVSGLSASNAAEIRVQ